MSNEASNGNTISPHLAKAFQDAYQKAVMLQRIDEQLAQLAARRKQLVDEIRQLQGGLNDEFARLISGEGLPADANVSFTAGEFGVKQEAVA